MAHGNTNDYTTMITTTTTTTLDSSSITKTTTSNGVMTNHGQHIDSPWKNVYTYKWSFRTLPFHRQILHTSNRKVATEADAGQTAVPMTHWLILVVESSAKLLLNSKGSRHDSKQSLKQLHLYLHVNHVKT